MSLIAPIPPKLRVEMASDPWYERCCLSGVKKSPWAKIEWHHAFTWKGKRLQEKWAIVPLHSELHAQIHKRWICEAVERIILNRADEETLRKYSKAVDLVKRRDRLNAQYEKSQPD